MLPKIDLLSIPKAGDEFDVGAAPVADVGAPTAAPKGVVVSPPPKGVFEADILPKAKDEPVDDGGNDEGVALSSNGLEVLYFTANLANISCSFPYCFGIGEKQQMRERSRT